MSSIDLPPQEQSALQTEPAVLTPTKTLLEKPAPKKKLLMIFVLTFLLLCLVLVGVTVAKYGLFTKTENLESSLSPISQSETSTDTHQVQNSPTSKPSPTPDLPYGSFVENKEDALYPGLDWKVDKGTKLDLVYETKKSTEHRISGEQWTVDVEELDEQTDVLEEFEEFYSNNKFAPNDHWTFDYDIDQYRMLTMNGDRRGSSTWGVFMAKDNYVQIIVVSYSITMHKYPSVPKEESGIIYLGLPRTTTYIVFISDPTPIANLLKKE